MKFRRLAPFALAMAAMGVLGLLVTAPARASTDSAIASLAAGPPTSTSTCEPPSYDCATPTKTYTKPPTTPPPTKPPKTTPPPTTPPPTTPPPTTPPPTTPPPTTATTPVQSPPAPTLPVTGASEMVLLATAAVLIIGGAVLLGLLRSRRKDATGR